MALRPPGPRRSHDPLAGTVSITLIGHATVMITTPGGRVIADPLLENSLFGVRRAKAAGLAEDIDDVIWCW